jgi:hypothetical protein
MTLMTDRKKRRTPHFQPPNLGNLVWQIVQGKALLQPTRRASVMLWVAAAGILTAYVKVQESRIV